MANQEKTFDHGAVIVMEPCIDCKQPWEMFESERNWWESQGTKNNLLFPKRCPDCRKKKKEKKLSGIPNELRDLAEKVFEGQFDGKQTELGNCLENLAVKIEQARP